MEKNEKNKRPIIDANNRKDVKIIYPNYIEDRNKTEDDNATNEKETNKEDN